MSKRAKGRKEPSKGGKGKRRDEDEADEEEEEIDLLNFPSLSEEKDKREEKYDTWLLIACAVTVASVYIATLYPSVPGGDSGELIIAAYQMGVAHPPGYPLFTILGHLFTYLPFGSPAWRVNLMSAMCGVLSSVFLYRTVARWSGNHAAGLLSATLFAFSPLVWTYTIQAEVFSMNNLLVNILLYLTVSFAYYFSKRDKKKYIQMAYLGALVGGFGASNQHTIVFIFIPIVFWIFFIVGRNDFLYEPRRWINLGLFMLLGLTPYLHMYLSPRIHQQLYSWGDTGTIGGFIHHFLRREYGTFKLYSGTVADTTGWNERIHLYFTRLATEILYVGIPLAVVGLWASLRGNKKTVFSSVGYLLFFSFLLYITLFFRLTNLPIQNPLHLGVLLRFFMQPNAIVCIWVGLGFAYLSSSLPLSFRSLSIFFVLLVSAAQISLNFSTMDQHTNYIFYKYGHALLDPLPKNSILLAGGDLQTNIPYYLQLCEGIRRDVDILSVETMSWEWHVPRQGPLYPNVSFPGYVYHPFKKNAYSMRQFLDANNKRPIFLAGEWKVGDNSLENVYNTAPFGLSQLVHLTANPPPLWEHKEFSQKALDVLNVTTFAPYPPSAKYGPETWEYVVQNNFWEAYERHANVFLLTGFKHGDDAEKCMKEAIKLLQYEVDNRGIKTKWTLKYLGAAWDHMRTWHPTDPTIPGEIAKAWNQFISLGNVPFDKEFDQIKQAAERFTSYKQA